MSGSVGNLRFIGNYQVVRALDPAGSMGAHAFIGVRRGARPGDGEPLRVLKLFQADPASRTQLLHQLPRLHRMRHPATTRVLECFDEGSRLVLVFEHHDGLRLSQLQAHLERENERLADAATWFIAHQLLGALAEAHASIDERGQPAPIVHGHLSPDTVHVDWDGTIRMIGLGMGPIMRDGASAFQPPEDVRARGAEAVDVYSVALMLWSLLGGREPPRPTPSLSALRQDVPGMVAEAIEQVLHPDPKKRVINCHDMQERLEESKKIVSEPAELRWNMELLRAASLFSQSGSTSGEVSVPDASVSSSSLPGLDSLADEPTSEGETLVATRQHYMRGPSDSQSFFDPETTLPAEGHDPDNWPTLLVQRPILPGEATPPHHMGSAPPPLMPPPLTPPPLAASGGDPSRLAVTMAARRPPGLTATPMSTPTPRATPTVAPATLAAIAAGALLLCSLGFAAGWLLKPSEQQDIAARTAQPTSSRAATERSAPIETPPGVVPPAVTASEEGLPPVREIADTKPLDPSEGHLVVRSPIDAYVYVQGVRRGRTNEKLRSGCDTRFVRLRHAVTHEWMGDGQPVAILCGATTTITIRP